MSKIDGSVNELNAIVLIGELRQDTAIWSQPYDPTFRFTDGQARSLYMRLQRIMNSPDFGINQIYQMDDGRATYITKKAVIDSSTLYCFITKEGEFDHTLITKIKQVVDRGSIYSPRKFYEEILDLVKHSIDVLVNILEEIDEPSKAIKYLEQLNLDTIEIDKIAMLLTIVGTSTELVQGPNLLAVAQKMLIRIEDERHADVLLDSTFVIATKYLENQSFQFADQLFEMIANTAVKFERLTLEIACRISSARILKLRSTDDGMGILHRLSPIDDGSLEVASQNDREEFYCLQAYAFTLLEDHETAEDLYSMAIMVAESESFPSMNKAEAHNYIGLRSSERYSYDISTREFLTASSIALRNGNVEMAKLYGHLASIQEIKWSNLLASTAIVNGMNGDISNSEYNSWQSLKRLLNAYTHADSGRRKWDLFPHMDQIVSMTKSVLASSTSDYAVNTIQEIELNLKNLKQGSLTPEFEKEILYFLLAKISAMIPLPTPIIMLIANDGRLILGGEVGAENWEASISANDELFSGALSAIMAILSEVTSSSEPLRMVDAGQTLIMIEKSKVCIGALLVDRDLNLIRKALRKTVEFMEAHYPDLENWDGYSVDFSDVKPFVDDLFIEVLSSVEN